jgi:glycosyltransferase involved in cell wall biosynthesis
LIKKVICNNIYFHGHYPYENLSAPLSDADILILPLVGGESLSYTVPNKLQAYLALGKPILVISSGEVARIAKEANCGFILERNNSDELIQIILNIINTNQTTLDIFGSNAYSYYKINFDHNVLIKELVFYFNKFSSYDR